MLKQDSGWTYGLLANHIWSFAGPRFRQNINETFLQPFVSYTTKTFTTFSFNTESTYDWANRQWNAPLNFTVNQLVNLGSQPVQFSLSARYDAEKPQEQAEWGLRFAVTLLFPK